MFETYANIQFNHMSSAYLDDKLISSHYFSTIVILRESNLEHAIKEKATYFVPGYYKRKILKRAQLEV